MHAQLTHVGAKRQRSRRKTAEPMSKSFETLDIFLKQEAGNLGPRPVALVFIEDQVEIGSTLRHHLDCGFGTVLAFMPDAFALPGDLGERVIRIRHEPGPPGREFALINQVIAAAPGLWLYYCYNAEYLFYPFCETRSVNEMLVFHTEERRSAMLAYVVDLYADDLDQHPGAVSLDHAHLDRSGYYALARKDAVSGEPLERQLDFFGGLRWRYEEHIPRQSRKIDRIALFRTRAGLTIRPDHTFDRQEYNTYACPWHHNLTAAICSFRTAKALKRNPGSTFEIQSFKWQNSAPFQWNSRQLMDLGLMEPGQWF